MGLFSLLATVAAATGFIYSKGRLSAPFRFWTLWFRTPISVLLYVLLVLQPISGWLLASLPGKLTTIFGFNPPALATPSGLLSKYVLTYCARRGTHSGVDLGLTWGAYAFKGLRSG